MKSNNINTCKSALCLILYLVIVAGAPAGEGRAIFPKALSDGQHPQSANRQLISKLATTSFPEKMLVYKRENPIVTTDYVTNQSTQLLQWSGMVKTQRTVFVTEGNLGNRPFRLEVDRTTGFITLEDIMFYEPKSKIRDAGAFPDAQEAKTIATAFLVDHNMLPEDAYLRGLVDNTKGADVISVGYGRRVRGVEVWGAGSEIIVDIGRGGRVVYVRKAWPTFKPIGEYNLTAPESALQKLKNGEGVLYHGNKGEIVSIKLVYYASPIVQDYVQPCYYADCLDPDTGKAFYGVIDAIETK